MKKKRVGLALLVASNASALLGGQYVPDISPQARWIYLLLFACLLWGSLLAGQGLLVWHYAPFFKKSSAVVLTVVLFSLCLAITRNQTLSVSPNWLVHNLYVLAGLWSITLILTIGIVLAIYLYWNDQATLAIGGVVLISFWGFLLYVVRRGVQQFFTEILQAQLPIVLTTLCCITIWLVPIGSLTFLLHTLRLLQQEFGDPSSLLQAHHE